MAVALVIAAAMACALKVALPAWLNSTTDLEAFTMVSQAADFLVRDLRVAGFDPKGMGFSGLAQADVTSLELLADLDGDGSLDRNSSERIRYRLSADGRSLMRVVGDQVMPILDGLEAEGFALRYFDSTGAEIPGPFPLEPAALGAVRAVEVTLRARRVGRPRAIVLGAFTVLRNP